MRLLFTLGCLLTAAVGLAAAPVPAAPLPFVANQGQWEPRVKYAVAIPNGRLYLENNCFTYSMTADTPGAHDAAGPREPVAGHAFRVTMVGAAAAPALAGEDEQRTYHNYFLGNDPARWAARVPLFAGVRYRGAYPGVDVRWHQQGAGRLEYDFELAPGARPGAIRLRYDGLDGLAISPEGHLLLRTSVGLVREQAPVAWQVSAAGRRRPVPCRFVLRGREVGFALGAGYDPAERLVIDPVLVFASYTGSSGFVSANATVADAAGNTYTAGYVLGTGYPVTLGAFKTTFSNGNIGISKLSTTGSNLLYATYLGGNFGSGNDYPLDLEVGAANELLILGLTTSSDYPTTVGAYDRTLSGQDLVLTRLNATGTALLASTFLGGSSNEAGGLSSVPAGLAIDPAGDVLVVSTTRSFDYPVLGAAQATPGGGADGVLTRFTPSLTALRWSTYLGGSGEDQAHDVKVAPNGDVYVCGLTSSSNLPVGAGGILPVPPTGGFGFNGFVLRYSATGARLAGTYLGTAGNDVARFLDFDAAGNVLVGGASDGAYPSTAGAYTARAANTTGVFVHALTPALGTTLFSTFISVIGAGALSFTVPSGSNVITGFGRDHCGRLYFSAYAGAIAAPGCPRTADAFSQQPRVLYLGVLAEGAAALLYGTYIGDLNNGQSSSLVHVHYAASNHVTRDGVLHHLTCSIGRSFGTTPGAFSAGLAASNDGLAFKFNLAPVGGGAVQVVAPAPAPGCAPYAVQFVNNSVGALDYSWDFGDGSPLDASPAPRHTYATAGTYAARLVATRQPGGPAGCGPPSASVSVPVVVVAPPPVRMVADSFGCGRPVVLDPGRLTPPATGRAYAWTGGSQTPTLTITTPGRYRVAVDQGQPCPLVIEYNVRLTGVPPLRTVVDSLGCAGTLVLDPARLTPFVSGRAYAWTGGSQLPTLAVTAPGRYRVEVDQGVFCPVAVEFNVVRAVPPPVRAAADSLDCTQRLVLDPARLLPALSGRAYRWTGGAQTPTLAITGPGRYRVEVDQGRLCPAVVEFNVRLRTLSAIPNILTVNGDALNAALRVPGAYGTPRLQVFNRWGRLVYETAAYRNDWTGTGQPAGVYYYLLHQPACDIRLRGWVELVR